MLRACLAIRTHHPLGDATGVPVYDRMLREGLSFAQHLLSRGHQALEKSVCLLCVFRVRDRRIDRRTDKRTGRQTDRQTSRAEGASGPKPIWSGRRILLEGKNNINKSVIRMRPPHHFSYVVLRVYALSSFLRMPSAPDLESILMCLLSCFLVPGCALCTRLPRMTHS